MKEVVRRRYQRAIEENAPLPDLIITDGGKGQMEVVREVIEDELLLNIPIAVLAKDNRHRTSELLFGFPPQTIGIKQHSALIAPSDDFFHRSVVIRAYDGLYIIFPVILFRWFGFFKYDAGCHCVRTLYVRVIETFNLQWRPFQMQFLLYLFHQTHAPLLRIQLFRLFQAVGLVLLHV